MSKQTSQVQFVFYYCLIFSIWIKYTLHRKVKEPLLFGQYCIEIFLPEILKSKALRDHHKNSCFPETHNITKIGSVLQVYRYPWSETHIKLTCC